VRRQSSATWLLLAYLGLVLYASLYPFFPWRWPPGMGWPWLPSLPWPRQFWAFDVAANLLGYLPLGLLGFAAAMRSGLGLRGGLSLGLLPWPLLSFLLETLQFFLPGRVPSLSDWALNSAGAGLGLLLGLLLNALGGLRRWQDLRDYWFAGPCAPVLALLALWPLALLYPTPLPFGLGQWLPWWRDTLVDALDGTPWALQWGDEALDAARALPPGLEALAIAFGLLAPVLLALSAARPGWRRLGLVGGAVLLGVLGTTVSTAMNFGPEHAWAWLSDTSRPGMALGGVLAVLACLLPQRAVAAVGLVLLSALIALISLAPPDPYLNFNLQAWQMGRFVSMYGLTRWLAWLWPFAVLGWLFARTLRRSG
jgi:VanZ family protein